MENKNIILIAIVVLIIAVGCVAGFVFTKNNDTSTTLNNTNNNTNTTNSTVTLNNTANVTATADNTTDKATSNESNTTYKVYNPQSDSYVPVIGEEYDEEVDRWYTYDSDGVRYYNTRIN